MKYAAIDIGTNAARLLIGEVTENNGLSFVKKISYTRVPLRLGFEVFTDGFISDEKTEQFIKTIKAYKLIADVYDVKNLRACATSAMREAENGLAVKKRIKDETGIDIEIIQGEEEANIIFSTFFLLAFDKASPFLVIDVGGGSTEVSVFEEGKKIAGKSFNIGTIRLLKEKVSPTIWDEINDWIEATIDINMPHKVFATGGNINKMHKLLNKRFMQPIKTREFQRLFKRLKKMSYEQRLDAYQLKPDRADVIVPACEIYNFILKRLDCKEIFVPKIGLSDGMIYEMFKKEKD
jgi:exopolyphosphatase/guanosine-5'-triphosphate,3'-diphosphate pyrophosphatase